MGKILRTPLPDHDTGAGDTGRGGRAVLSSLSEYISKILVIPDHNTGS